MKSIACFILVLLSSCKTQTDWVGSWKAGHYSLLQRGVSIWSGKRLLRGDVLFINPDSSWKYTGTCMEWSGSRLRLDGDTLTLIPERCNAPGDDSEPLGLPYFRPGTLLKFHARNGKLSKHFRGSLSSELKLDSTHANAHKFMVQFRKTD